MGRETILTTANWNEGEFPTFAPVRGVESGPLPPVDKNIPGIGYVSLLIRILSSSYAVNFQILGRF